MAKRGRKSSAVAVAVLPDVDPSEIESIARPEPPEGLDVSVSESSSLRRLTLTAILVV